MEQNDTQQLIVHLCQTIYDKKGFNILALDLRGISSMTDYFLIAEGSVERHVKTLGSSVLACLEGHGVHAAHTEGFAVADWIVIDTGDVVIHVFTPELRQKYALEELWHDGRIVDVPIHVHKRGEV